MIIVKKTARLVFDHPTPGAARIGATLFLALLLAGCGINREEEYVRTIPPQEAAAIARSLESKVAVVMADGLKLSLWASDSLVADPVSIHVDEHGALYYTRTNRQKNSEFEIRAHQDWETASIRMATVDDRSAFLKQTLSPERSDENAWLADLNKDGSHDWKDLTVEQEEVYRLEDRSGDGVADFAKLILKDFHSEVTDVAGAILTWNDDLFIGVSPDMWRLKDRDNDGYFEEKVSISHGYGVHIGFGGHGMSGLEVGPDGKLYWQIGDLGFHGKDINGEPLPYPNTGVIVRANPDGSDFEVFAFGNRNTHEFVFDDYGNLITVDNDGDHPGEKERLIYVVNGADIGWRINWQFGKYRDPDNNRYKVWMDEKMYLPRFDGQAAYFLPPLANYVSGPTGMLYNPGTALSKGWKNTFFIGEFVGNPATSGIHSFKLKPKGASFELTEDRTILTGVLATGVDFGPDGALYLADWIEGWGTKNFGRIWKLDVQQPDTAARNETRRLLSRTFDEYHDEALGGLLKHEDRRVRQKAQFELAKRNETGLVIFKSALAQRDHQLARVHSIWGISQLARKDRKHAEHLMPLLTDTDSEIRAQAAKWLGDIRYQAAAPSLIPLLRDSSSRVRFFAAEALGRIAHEPALNAIIAMLRDNNDEDVYLRHAGSLALARIGNAEAVVQLHNDPSKAVRIAAVIALRRMADPGIAKFLDDPDEFIVTETARAINDDRNIPGALPALAGILLKTSFENEPLIRRSINANLEMGTDEALQALVEYSRRPGAPLKMRQEALSAIGTWSNPSVLDRVDGTYRGELTRDPEQAIKLAVPGLVTMLSDKASALRGESARALGKLKAVGAAESLFTTLQRDGDPGVRLAVLRALNTLGGPFVNRSIRRGLADPDRSVRVVALELLSASGIPPEEKVVLLQKVIDEKTIEEKQAAIATLGSLPLPDTRKALEDLMARAENDQLPVAVNIEFSEAIQKSGSRELLDRYDRLKRASPDTLLFEFQGALSGGVPERGRSIFYYNDKAQCMRCHSFDDFGGNAGPRLNGIGTRLSEKEILEALVQPGKRIAPGFGTIALKMKDGKKISGILQAEDAVSFIVKSGQKEDTLLMKRDVAENSLSGSSMPPMHLLLTKREIRDLVSFLSTLKE